MRKNLISKKTGIRDHMMSDAVTDRIFPKADKYNDTIDSDESKYGCCIKNQYVSIDWIKHLIKSKYWESVGKEKALYEYFVDDGNINKPNSKTSETEEELYIRASGDMQFDFDDLNYEQIEDIKNAFLRCSKKNPCYHWFEYSWSGHGCHIRVWANLKMKTKLEWGFWYIHLLNAIIKYVSDDNREEIIKHIDWSCCSVTRGFAIPYNKDGVLMGMTYDEQKCIEINNEDQLDKIFNKVNCEWQDELFDHYVKKFIAPKKKKELEKLGLINDNNGFMYSYSMECDWQFNENHPIVSGEEYNYNWRLSLVTTLMAVFNNNEDIVRSICSVIYKYIGEYKNHTYDEMIGNELENKIFKRANFNLEPSHKILNELWNDWGLKITARRRYT